MREILALPDAERVETVRQKPSRYSGAELSRLLLEQARGQLPAEPGQAYALAGLARAVLQHGNATSEATELYALALAHQGNALRAQGELVPAEEFLESARFLLDAQGPGNPRPRAELDSLEGSLRWAQRRFDEAKALLTRAVAFQMAEEQPVEAARALLKLGLVYWEEGALPHAIDCATRAASVFSEHGETKLLLMALHNLAFCLLEAGEGERSRATFAESLPLYEQFDDLRTQLRRVWLEGHLSKAEGNVEAAEDAFRAVRDGFLEQGVGYDAAIAALDLAFLYAERGRTAELKRVAEEIVPVFEAQDVHREAAAALMLFQEAVRQERATVQFLGDLTRYLEQARRDPSLRFRQGETAGRGSAG
ncbi:MAG TPA: tetratricopeptide repeat protein [Thermoanaerobaculia bacterium]|nr:tetratricopeptide repeat protein [Thermoanaerobaculia bacterium]